MLSKLKNRILKLYICLLRVIPLHSRIVFESLDDLTDNPRAIYDYCNNNGFNKWYKFVWIVNDVEYCKRKLTGQKVSIVSNKNRSLVNQLKLQYYLSTSKWFLFSHPWWFQKRRKSQIVVDVTHGLCIKGATNNKKTQESFDWLVAPSEYSAELYSRFWYMPIEKAIICGVPRNDQLFVEDRPSILGKIIASYNPTELVIICMPTYRRSKTQIDSTILDKYCIDVISDTNQFMQLNDYLCSAGIHLIIKPHPLQITDDLMMYNTTNIHYIDNGLLLEKDVYLYNLIGCCDALITDLSSVYCDYLVLNRPIGFLTKDYENYKRGFNMDNPLDYMPGKRINCFEDLFEFLNDLLENNDPYTEERTRVNLLFNGKYTSNRNCQSFVEWMLQKDGNKKAQIYKT